MTKRLSTLPYKITTNPRWLSGKEYACQCRGHGFGPWVSKIPCSRKWQPTPVFLPGKSHGHRSLVSYSPWGRKRVRYSNPKLLIYPSPPAFPLDKCKFGFYVCDLFLLCKVHLYHLFLDSAYKGYCVIFLFLWLTSPWCWGRLKAGGERDDRGWMASPTQWRWVGVDSGKWWWTGNLVCCSPWGCTQSDTTE